MIVSDGVWIQDAVDFRLSRFFAMSTHGWLRPVVLLVFKGLHGAAGLHFAWYYAFNIFLHCVNTALVYFIALSLCGRNFRNAGGAACLSALIFAVLFPHYEGVILISTLHDLIMTFFCLVSFLLFAKAREKKATGLILVSAACFALGMLSKENALFFPFVLLIYGAVFPEELPLRRRASRSFMLALPHVLVLLVYSAYYTAVILPEQNKTVTRFVIPSPAHQIVLNADSLFDLLISSFGWIRDAYFHFYRSLSPPAERVFLGSRLALWASSAFVFLFFLLKKFSLRPLKPLAALAVFCAAWMIFNFYPATFSIEATLRDFILFPRFRYFYMPSAGLSILLGACLAAAYETFPAASNVSKGFFYVFVLSFLISNSASTRIMIKGYEAMKENYKKLVFSVGSACKGTCGAKTIYLIRFPDGYRNFYREGLKQAVDLHFDGNVKLVWMPEEKLRALSLEKMDVTNSIFIEMGHKDKMLYDRTSSYRNASLKKREPSSGR